MKSGGFGRKVTFREQKQRESWEGEVLRVEMRRKKNIPPPGEDGRKSAKKGGWKGKKTGPRERGTRKNGRMGRTEPTQGRKQKIGAAGRVDAYPPNLGLKEKPALWEKKNFHDNASFQAKMTNHEKVGGPFRPG